MSGKRHPWGCTCRTHVDRPWNRPEHWTLADCTYLEDQFGQISDAAIARRLGRSIVGIRLKAKRLGLRKKDAALTAREVARLLGMPDSKIVATWVERGLLRARRMPWRQGPSPVWRITERALEAFIREHGQYVNADRVPPDSPFAAIVAEHSWIPLSEVRRRTGLDPWTVTRDYIRSRVVRAARRGTHWFVAEADVDLLRRRSPEDIADAVFRRESTLEARRNRRKGVGVAA